jgi:hypothetical protein
MRPYRLTLGLAVVLTLLPASCGSRPRKIDPPSDTTRRIEASVVVDQPTIPDEEAYEFAAVAPNGSELARQWRRFRLAGKPPDVDLESHVVLLVGFGESGSCPYEHSGVLVERAAGLVSLIEAGSVERACTDDYNPRTIGFAIDRRDLPDGIFRVIPPNGAPVSVAAAPVRAAPQEEPDVISAAISDVRVTLDPDPAQSDGTLRVSIRNDGDSAVATAPPVRLDRWTGVGFEPASPDALTANGDVVVVRPGAQMLLLSADLAGYGLGPGWYRVTVDLDVTTGGFGRLLVRRAVELISS